MLIKEKECNILCITLNQDISEPAELLITGKNLVRRDYRRGYLKTGLEKLQYSNSPEHRTTKWFPVDAAGGSLVMSGDAYNRAVWQFGMEDGTTVTHLAAPARYRLRASKLFGLTFPKVKIPHGAVRARVFYARTVDEETAALGKRLQIEYGRIPTEYEEFSGESIPISNAKAGDSLFYCTGDWYFVPKNNTLDIELIKQQICNGERNSDQKAAVVKQICPQAVLLKQAAQLLRQGSSLFLTKKKEDGTITQLPGGMCCSFPLDRNEAENLLKGAEELEKKRSEQRNNRMADLPRNRDREAFEKIIYTGSYGIRHRIADPVPICERTGAAAGLRFNYMLETEPAAPYDNDFDHIYPWAGMRRCAISYQEGIRRVIYEGDAAYRTDGTAGEIMVEIPKHYVRRVVTSEYETIEISNEPAEGFVLDPSFLTREGEQEYIYVGAYFASEHIGGQGQLMLGSRSDAQVSMYRTGSEFLQLAEANPGFEEEDLCAALTLQRLFVVETAMLDSKSVFEGNIYMPYMISDKMSTYYSLDSAEQTNTIRLTDNSISRRFLPGNAVAIMNSWPDYDSPEYANRKRVVTGRRQRDDGSVEISFSGSPVNLTAHGTGISELPEYTGGPDRIAYHTGAGTESLPEVGHDAFKYRGIENLWGGIWVVLQGCSVTDSVLTVEYPDKRTAKLNYALPVQNVELSSKCFGAPDEMCVKKMGYDEAHPLIALPSEIGNGASTCTWYCDAWYNQAEPGKKYIVTYGGAWDNMGYAGVFAFRASFRADQKITFNGARLMNRAEKM